MLDSNQRPIVYCTTLIFTSIILNIICSLDFLFTISYNLGRWCKVSTHSFRLARCYHQLFCYGFHRISHLFIYKFPYRAANILVLKPARQPSALPTELTRNIYWRNLFSQQGNPQISSAHWSLTSVFGMGTGISSMLLSPEMFRKLLF